jgi:FMN hydrolase / 5-amino-6-(5-phospho-D-ribitylamino)uracil phosphatase
VDKKIKILCFDLDDTLWPVQPVMQHAENALRQWLLRYYPLIPKRFTLNDMQLMRQQLLEQQPELFANLHHLRRLNLIQVAQAVNYDLNLVEPALQVFDQARHKVKLYDDVLPCLTKLYQHYKLCALTNGSADVKRIPRLAHLFSLSLRACDVGHAKPHPALFDAVCKYFNVSPNSVLHVGDCAEADVNGALKFGMYAVWINRNQFVWSAQHQPHAVISSLIELEPLLTAGVGFEPYT